MMHGHHDSSMQIATIILVAVITTALPAQASWQTLAGGPAGAEPVVMIHHLDPATVTVEVTVPGFLLETVRRDGMLFSQVKLPGSAPLLTAGHPELPVLSRAVELPATGNPSLEIVAAEWRTLPALPPVPSRGPLSRSGDLDQVPYTMAAVYQAAGLWPAQPVELGEPFLVRDRRGVALRLHPVRWNATSGALEALVRLELRVVTTGSHGINPVGVPTAAAERSFAPIYQTIFTGAELRDKTVDGPVLQADPESQERLLIVTAATLRPAVSDLAAWKRAVGYSVEVVDIDALGGSAQGIHAAVHSRYHEAAGLAHLLLVGDVSLVPTNSGRHEGAASDGHYGLVAGDDLFIDVLVSRLPARNETELRTMIDRTIAYERDPQVAAGWYTSAVGIASDEGHPADYDRAEWLRSSLLAGSYTDVDRIYQGFGGDRDAISNAVDSGVSLINYLGHGAAGGWLSVPFGNADVHQLTNTAAWPWIIDVSCTTGDFRQAECFAEAWLRASHQGQPTGAVAVIASSTETSWVPPTVMQSAMVDHLVQTGRAELGALLATGIAAVLIQYDGTDQGLKLMEQYNLFGDGTLRVRSRQPQPLLVTHADRLAVGAEACEVLAPIGARVVLSTATELLARADQLGTAPVRLVPSRPLNPGEVVTLTVTAPDSEAYQVDLVAGEPSAQPVVQLPEAVALLGNWPNPFNPQTTVGLSLPEASLVRLGVHDVRGRLVRLLVDGHLSAGTHDLIWDGCDHDGRPVVSGVYLARLVTAGVEQVHKLTLVR